MRAEFSKRACALNNNSLISPTDSCVVGYNVQHCKIPKRSKFNAAVNTLFHFPHDSRNVFSLTAASCQHHVRVMP